MEMKCLGTTDLCPAQAYYVIIYGCFNDHIREVPMCADHTEIWLQKYSKKKWSCNYCYKKKIEEIWLCLAGEIKTELNL